MPISTEFIYENINIFEKYTCGFKIGKCLGQGAFGSAFSSNNKDWVIKITNDFEEAFACEQISKLREKGYEATLFPGFVEIYSVKKVEEINDYKDLYVIVREVVEPLNPTSGSKFTNDLDKSLHIIGKRQEHSEEELTEAMEFVKRHAPALYKSILETYCHDFELLDVRIHNVGFTCKPRYDVPSNSLIMFDVAFRID